MLLDWAWQVYGQKDISPVALCLDLLHCKDVGEVATHVGVRVLVQWLVYRLDPW
jgi:hypothetical protein